jgi:hypothetical protein
MEKFLLLVREDLKRREKMSPAEFDHQTQLMSKWVESMAQAGNYLQADPLDHGGRYVGRDYVLSDGPFIEAKESISGFILITAENLEQAVSIAQNCPLIPIGVGVVEVRRIMISDE